jgi:hypothetical protein
MAENQTTTPAAESIIKAGDNLDFEALREFSAAETEKELAVDPDKFKSPITKEKKEKKTALAKPLNDLEDEVAEEESSEEEESEETPEEDEQGDEEEEEEDGTEEEASEDEEEAPAPKKSSKAVKVKDGGKEVEISRTALVPVTVDGKVKEIPLADVLQEYSGRFHFQQESSKLGRERKTFEEERTKFTKEAETINENINLLYEAAQGSSPEQVVEIYAMLTGRDPNEVMENIVVNAIQFAKEYAELTPEQRKLKNEYRRLKFQKDLTERRAEKSARVQKTQAEQAKVLEALKSRGLTNEDWISAAAELKDKLEAGELESVSPFDVVEHAAKMKRASQVTEAISQVDKSLLDDNDFKTRVVAAVVQTEELTGSKMKPGEIRRMVQVVREDSNKRFKERLSRKADRAQRGNAAISESAKSRKHVETGPLTLGDHFSRVYGEK